MSSMLVDYAALSMSGSRNNAVRHFVSMQISLPQLRDRVAALIKRIRDYDIVVPAGSRLRRYAAELEAAAPLQYSDPPEEVRRIWHRLLAEVDDFEQIVSS